jgi:hydrogenase-4 component E
MHISLTTEPVSAVLAIIALWMIGVTQYHTTVVLFGIQTTMVGALAVWIGWQHNEPMLIFVGAAVILFKGIAAPIYLSYAAKKIGCRRERGLAVAPPIQLFAAGAAIALLALSHPFRGELPVTALPSIDILFLGMLFMVTRRLAVSQIIGFLMLENGIFLFTVTLPHPMPALIDMGVLMDVLAGTMLAGMLAFKINTAFEHIDVTQLKELHG